MPFEPRLFDDQNSDDRAQPRGAAQVPQLPPQPVWDDAEALDLPDDLAAFAEQLRDDAQYLAQCHPADASDEQRERAWQDVCQQAKEAKPVAQSIRYISMRWASAAAVLLIAIVGLGSAWVYSQRQATTETAAGVPTDESAVTIAAAASDPAPGLTDELPPNRVQPISGPQIVPASFLREVTGPELDGMLDLLEQEESGLSI